MPNINLLDQNTINKIAAGEVIERPAAVAKELIENAIDAGATAITIEIKEGGIAFLRITDNGAGISKEEIPLAFLRHATSKIKSVEDLLMVSSLGFRGEALSSISAVAQIELVTKTKEAFIGTRYIIEGGKEKSLEEIGCPNGTTFVIRNLFFNTPARRKFLKAPGTEAAYISDFVERLAVSHPNISFKFINNNKLKLHTSGNSNLKDIIYHVYGREITSQLLSVEKEEERVSVHGFIAKPIVSRGNRNYMSYYINGRYIKSDVINKAIEDAYKPYSMTHRYPFTALHLKIDSKMIDVNVHPTKMEIRFTDKEFIYSIILETLSLVLKGKELIPEVSLLARQEKKEVLEKTLVPEPFEKKRMLQEAVQGNKSINLVREDVGYVSRDQKNQCNHNKTTIEQENSPSKASFLVAKENGINVKKDKENDRQNAYSPASTNKRQIEAVKQMNQLEQKACEEKKEAQISLFEHKLLSEEAKKHHKIVGQLFQTYWVVEYDNKMFIIDQHAAHEKVLYERTMKALKEKEFSSQMIEPPIILSLNMREEEVLQQYQDTLKQIGFEIEAFGGKEYSVRAVPADLFGIAQADLLTELIDNLVEDNPVASPNLVLEKVASMSCKAAVKGNQRLSAKEAESLIENLLQLENPYHCPHGRPVIIALSKYELEKKFKRIV